MCERKHQSWNIIQMDVDKCEVGSYSHHTIAHHWHIVRWRRRRKAGRAFTGFGFRCITPRRRRANGTTWSNLTYCSLPFLPLLLCSHTYLYLPTEEHVGEYDANHFIYVNEMSRQLVINTTLQQHSLILANFRIYHNNRMSPVSLQPTPPKQ